MKITSNNQSCGVFFDLTISKARNTIFFYTDEQADKRTTNVFENIA